jgi:hypothetical protein
MMTTMNYPLLVFVVAFVALWLSARLGAYLRKRRRVMKDGQQQDFRNLAQSLRTAVPTEPETR